MEAAKSNYTKDGIAKADTFGEVCLLTRYRTEKITATILKAEGLNSVGVSPKGVPFWPSLRSPKA